MKIFETNFENGSLIDKIGGIVLTPFGAISLTKTDRGFTAIKTINNDQGSYIYSAPIFDINKSYSLIFNISHPSLSTWMRLFGSTGDVATGVYPAFNVYHQANPGFKQIQIRLMVNITTGISINFNINPIKNNYCLTYNGSKKASGFRLFEHGIEITSKSILIDNLTTIALNNQYRILSPAGGAAPYKGTKYYKLSVFNHILTQKEINQEYVNFLNSKPLNKPIIFNPNLNILKPTEIKEIGLIAAYNFNQTVNKLINVAWDNPANNFNARQYDGTINNCQVLNDGMSNNKFGNTKNYIEIPLVFDERTTFSVCFTEYVYNNGGRVDFPFHYPKNNVGNSVIFLTLFGSFPIILIGTTNNFALSVSSNTKRNQYNIYVVSINTQGRIFLYVNGLKIIDQIINIGTIASTSLVKKTYIFNGDSQATYNAEKIIMRNLKIYNRAITDEEAKNYYNQFANKEMLFEDFNINYAIGQKPNINWVTKSGSWVISEQTLNNNIQYILGQKYLKCSSSGIIYIQQKNSYGTFYFNNVLLLNNNDRIIFNTNRPEINKQNGYAIERLSSTTIRLVSLTNGVSTSLLSNNTLNLNNKLYDFQVQRKTNNIFTVYYKQSGQNIWILLGVITDLTYTTSTYLSLQFGTNSYISSIKILQGVIN